MTETYSIQVLSVIKSIEKLNAFKMKSYVHCSKINYLLDSFEASLQIFKTSKTANRFSVPRRYKKSLENLEKCISDFSDLCNSCTIQNFQEFIFSTSIKEVFNRFFTIRESLITIFNAIDIPECASIFSISPDVLCSQNYIDLKRIYAILLEARNCPGVPKKPIEKRLLSIKEHGFQIEPTEIESISIPSAKNLIIQHEDVASNTLIGKGRSCKVYAGQLLTTGEVVAVKFINARSLTYIEGESLQREIYFLSTLKHPNLVRLIGYSAEPPFFLITELMTNGSLFNFLKTRSNELSATDRTLIAIDVASGMEYIHGQKILHRDLKSLNILLDENKRAKICDFGLARTVNRQPPTGRVGTPQWMAPEVLSSASNYDFRVDVYSFGVVLWELLTSKVPYEGIPEKDLPFLVVNTGLRPEIPPNTPPYLSKMIKMCWDAEPTKRPSFTQIRHFLTDIRYSFPGTDPSALPRRSPQRSTSGVDPGIRSIREKVINAQKLNKVEALPPNIRQSEPAAVRTTRRTLYKLVAALEKKNDILIRQAISEVRSDILRGLDPGYIREMIVVTSEASPHDQPALFSLLGDIASNPATATSFLNEGGPQFIATSLERSDNELPPAAEGALSILEIVPKLLEPEIILQSAIKALFAFSNAPDLRARARALNILVKIVKNGCVSDSDALNYIAKFLDFALLPLPNESLQDLFSVVSQLIEYSLRSSSSTSDNLSDKALNSKPNLSTSEDKSDSKSISSIPRSVLARLPGVLAATPAEIIESAVNMSCLAIRNSNSLDRVPESLWKMAGDDFKHLGSIFSCAIGKYTSNPKPIFSALKTASNTDPEAISILAKMVPISPDEIILLLPLTQNDISSLQHLKSHHHSSEKNLVQHNSSHHHKKSKRGKRKGVYAAQELVELYTALIKNIEDEQKVRDVLKQPEIYSACIQELSNEAGDIMRRDEINAQMIAIFAPEVSKRTLVENCSSKIFVLLGIVYKWSSLGMGLAFEPLLDKLHGFLRNSENIIRLGAFLSLNMLLKSFPDKISVNDLLIAAMFYVNRGSETARKISLNLVINQKIALENDAENLANIFLRFYISPNESSIEVIRTFNNLHLNSDLSLKFHSLS